MGVVYNNSIILKLEWGSLIIYEEGVVMNPNYQELEAVIRKYHPQTDLGKVKEAFDLASKAHEGQLRQSGEPYVIHPLNVALILASLELDLETIMAGLLHDVVEDTSVTLDDIRTQFGNEVAELVDGVTKLKQLTYTTNDKEEIQAENYRKMFLAMAKDIRVIMVKLADRLHNMRTLEYKSVAKQYEKAKETLDIYAPIAQRLGISKIKVELEDLCLKYLEPDVYYDLVAQIHGKLEEREKSIAKIVAEIQEHLTAVGIKANVNGRPKHFFSIYRKMINKHKTLDQIYDLLAVRAIVDSVKDCYGVLGVIHEMYTPMPGRFKDYIAMPKANMYQSLHTTVIGPSGEPFEVQIRTIDMHRTAEYGIAAHWKYKAGGVQDVKEKEKLEWLQKILEWQQDMSDNKEFVDSLKRDLDAFQENVYCFSPKGEVINLPMGATPIDFAYMIHSAVGNKMVGARVNGRIVNLDYKLINGDRVEILTSQNSKGPSRDWLKIAVTSQARSKINQWFKKEFKQENINKGRELMEKYAKSKGLPPMNELLKTDWIELVLRKYGFREWDMVLATIGHGGLKEGQVVNRLYEEYRKENPVELTEQEILEKIEQERKALQAKEEAAGTDHKHSPITVRGIHDVAVRYSRCCNPLPGDEIIGYVTRGRGVSIHRTDCINVLTMPEMERRRLIDAEWEVGSENAGEKFISAIQVITDDRKGMVAEISNVISNADISIDAMSARRTKKQSESVFNISVEISAKDQLEMLINRLYQIPGVHEIIRASN